MANDDFSNETPIAKQPWDNDARRLIAMIKAAAKPALDQLPPSDARLAYHRSRFAVQPALPDVADAKSISADLPSGPMPMRRYRGIGAPQSAPALVYLHGGGWVVGDLDTHDYVCRKIANEARCIVLSLDYPLAPEHKFPSGINASVYAVRWIFENAKSLEIDSMRIGVGGDSAGGNLAAVLALMARDGDLPTFAYQMLLYPAVDLSMRHDSYARTSDDLPLTTKLTRYFRDHYLREEKDALDWRASPLSAPSHADVAPAFILTARHDPLRDEGVAYARKLEDAGVRVWHVDMNDQVHGFLTMGKLIRAADPALEMASAALRYFFTI